MVPAIEWPLVPKKFKFSFFFHLLQTSLIFSILLFFFHFLFSSYPLLDLSILQPLFYFFPTFVLLCLFFLLDSWLLAMALHPVGCYILSFLLFLLPFCQVLDYSLCCTGIDCWLCCTACWLPQWQQCYCSLLLLVDLKLFNFCKCENQVS